MGTYTRGLAENNLADPEVSGPRIDTLQQLARVATETGGANILIGAVPDVDIADVKRLEAAREAAIDDLGVSISRYFV